MKTRVYVCHTFYHVYVSFLKECHLRREQKNSYKKADIVLSTICTDFDALAERMKKTDFFEEIFLFHEKKFEDIPELDKYKKDRGIVLNMFSRIVFGRKLSKYQEPLVPVDFKKYQDVYVYCDSDPIGYYLNFHHIHYHAMEDGLDCLSNFDASHFDNRGAFKFKTWAAAKNLIFIQNGYSKYCLDMEVNNLSRLKYSYYKYREVPRKDLINELTQEDKNVILNSFIDNVDEIRQLIVSHNDKQKMLVLTEELCDETGREKMFRDLIEEYCKNADVFIKPHPRDKMDYRRLFPDQIVLDRKFPMEMLGYIDGLRFDTVFSVLTELGEVCFSDKCVRLGHDFLDQYLPPETHRYNEQI